MRRIWLAVALALTIPLAPQTAFAQEAQKAGDAAPEIEAQAWFNATGTPTLTDLHDKVVVIEFWATWCPPCRDSIPHLNSLHAKYKDKNVVIIGLSNEASDKVKAFVASQKMNYVVGAGSQTMTRYGVKGIPTAFVVVDGKITWTGHPMNKRFDKAIEDAVAAKSK